VFQKITARHVAIVRHPVARFSAKYSEINRYTQKMDSFIFLCLAAGK